jgi:hypothetical protein
MASRGEPQFLLVAMQRRNRCNFQRRNHPEMMPVWKFRGGPRGTGSPPARCAWYYHAHLVLASLASSSISTLAVWCLMTS